MLEHTSGFVTGEAGGYIVAGERYTPDVAFISSEKQAQLAKFGYNPNPPDLAVEVVSSDTKNELDTLRVKITNYLAVGTVVWIVKPNDKLIEVHAPNQPVTFYRQDETLLSEKVLPGLTINLSEIFSD